MRLGVMISSPASASIVNETQPDDVSSLKQEVLSSLLGPLTLTCLLCPLSSVPAAVSDVTVSNNGCTDFLSVAWRPAAGDVDSYLVTLRDGDRTLHVLAVSTTSPECVFNSLVSGRLYDIIISSRSGPYDNHTVVQERTREETKRWETGEEMGRGQEVFAPEGSKE